MISLILLLLGHLIISVDIGIRFENICSMKSISIFISLFCAYALRAQQPHTATASPALPAKIYNTLRDSCTQLDIVFLTGKGGSMSLEGKNVRYFTQFVDTKIGSKNDKLAQDGQIMWQINGREFQSGKIFFSSDSSGYIVFERANKEYVNALTTQGAGFLKTRGGK